MTNGGFVALVPMKGHSERVPGKNLRPIAGKPLCLWIVETLLGVPEVELVAVNTDDARIAALVRALPRVVVHDRPEAIRGDFVSMNRIIEDDLARLPGRELFLQTHATNPLLGARTVRRALAEFLARRGAGCDSLFSVTRHQARFYDAGGRALNHDPEALLRTQDLDPLFEENSCLYVFSRGSFAARGRRIGPAPGMFEMDPLEAVDIDDVRDFRLAEALLSSCAKADGGDAP
jgi:CMP-N-acetylneuraminic acid synthetase